MKTWLSIFLPNDEYKRERLLLFIAEGATLMVIAMILSLIIGPFEASFSTLIFISIFVFYVLLRYIFSGIEFGDVASQAMYKRKRKEIIIHSVFFAVIFMGALYFTDGPQVGLQAIPFVLFVAIFYFLINFISLKRSYKKNQELLD